MRGAKLGRAAGVRACAQLSYGSDFLANPVGMDVIEALMRPQQKHYETPCPSDSYTLRRFERGPRSALGSIQVGQPRLCGFRLGAWPEKGGVSSSPMERYKIPNTTPIIMAFGTLYYHVRVLGPSGKSKGSTDDSLEGLALLLHKVGLPRNLQQGYGGLLPLKGQSAEAEENGSTPDLH